MTEERVPYLGFWIERKCGEDPDWVWCQTIVEEDEGSRTFALTERVHYDKRRSAGWPHDTGEVQGQLRRQGLAIARALIALDTIPDGQNAKVDLPAAGPPYVTPDGDLLALLILRGFRNLRSTYRNLGEDSLDVRGIGELLWASPNETEHIFERLRNGGLAEILSMGWDDNFGNAEATEVGLQVLDENDPILPTDVRGFAIREGSSDPPTPDLDSPDGVGDVGDAVFVVHGRNVAAKETVARWIERVSLRSIILHERANRGRTIIEKFDQEADGATYAVALRPATMKRESLGQTMSRARPRQNVLLELGFFLGRLGRENVSVLRSPDIERPSDYDGVVYIDFDESGAWKLALATELKVAGLPIDESRMIGS